MDFQIRALPHSAQDVRSFMDQYGDSKVSMSFKLDDPTSPDFPAFAEVYGSTGIKAVDQAIKSGTPIDLVLRPVAVKGKDGKRPWIKYRAIFS